MPGVLQRALPIGVERNLDLDHLFERRRVAPHFACAFREGWQELVAVQLGALTTGADEPIAHTAGVFGHLRTTGGNQQRHTSGGPIVHRSVGRLVVHARVADPILRPQTAHQRHSLAQPRKTLAELRPFDTRRSHFVERFAGADAQHHPIGKQDPQRAHRLGNHGWVVAEGRRDHAGAHHDALHLRAQRAQPGE